MGRAFFINGRSSPEHGAPILGRIVRVFVRHYATVSSESLGHPLNPLVPFRRVIVKGRLGGSELSLPASGLLGLVCEGISFTT